MEEEMKTIREELASLRRDVEYLKRAIDPDTVLTHEEREQVTQARRDLAQGRTLGHDELKRELGL